MSTGRHPAPSGGGRWARLRRRLRALVRHPEFSRGAREMAGVAVGIGMWGLVTGVAMVKSGMSLPAAVAMSLLVYSGTAQLAALPLIAAGAPIAVVLATATCLNLRFVVFSVQWRPYFEHLPLRQRALLSYFCADLNYVMFMRRWPEPRPEPGQLPYFWGGVLMVAGSWQLFSILGMVLGQRVPEHWGLGFAGTLALLAMCVGMLSDRSARLPAAVAAGAAVFAFSLPLKLNLLVAIGAAVAVGLMADAWSTRRTATPTERRP